MITRSLSGASARRFVVATLALLLIVLATVPASLAESGKVRIAVVDFNTDAIRHGWRWNWSHQNLARAASDNLATQLVKTGQFRVIERQQLDLVLQEQNLGESGRLDPTTAARIGKILGVQLVVIGSVTEFGMDEKKAKIPQIGRWKWGRGVGGKMVTGHCALTARLVDTTTAEILAVGEANGKHRFGSGEFAGASLGTTYDSGAISKVLAEAVTKLAADLSAGAVGIEASTVRGGVTGKIAKVSGDKVYVNVGGASGVKVGDRFQVTDLGEAIIDPDTGENLGGEETVIGEIEITKILNEKLSIGRVVSGAGFAAGNRVRMK